ncbi:uncharacterized protein BYT42DRAFT_611969 [Radiomyces spectabilis]|uniref:uncharacterized protein n=1 Tax=Radiomyces spectabilis TaxID=64574 RepID=UPI002220F8A8|nr:uncharacterized protein BYT42DRAFT_611969 [Radiomyces spectabilis]KAI8384251.1 hypothetical protein BYT42DRAFT_611969 [Radiomyces spectabilis]
MEARQYEDVLVGKGRPVAEGDKVRVHYTTENEANRSWFLRFSKVSKGDVHQALVYH